MENTNKTAILDLLIKIFEGLENSHFEKEILEKLDAELVFISEYLSCTKIQAAFFSIIFCIQNKTGEAVSFSTVVDYMDENGLYLLKYVRDVNQLIEKELVSINPEGNIKSKYLVPSTICNKIIENRPIESNTENLKTHDIIFEFYDLIITFKNKKINHTDYKRKIENLEKRYAENEVVKNISEEYSEDFAARIILYSLCYRVIYETDYQMEDEDNGFSYKIVPVSYYRELTSKIDEKSHDLFVKDYIMCLYDVSDCDRRYGTKIVKSLILTQKGIDKFFGTECKSYEAEENQNSEQTRMKQFLVEFSQRYESGRGGFGKILSLKQIEQHNQELDIVKKFKKIIPNNDDRFILFDCCHDFVNLGSLSSLSKTLKDMYGEGDVFSKKIHDFMEEKQFLLTEGFLYLNKQESINKTTLELSDRTIELIYGKDADLYIKRASSQDIIEPQNLKEKTLFYSEDILNQINMLGDSLENKNLIKMQQRLEAKGLPQGIAVLLYGAPGTGKTESVYQLAKKTNRKIYHVDISQTKSMWFGESEKIIKKIFVNYKNLCKSCQRHGENIPILLFNEADAIISKRKSVDSGNTVQTENAIQNIILEQLEKLEGIMIATTNLCDNLDSAFERRFLFKVKFNKPEIIQRSKIWKDKLNWLTEEDAYKIASNYDFSGGEIENIVRKCEIDEIITGDSPDICKVEELCKVEKFVNEEKRGIGFSL